MNISSFANTTSSSTFASSSKNGNSFADKLTARLRGMEDQTFVRLDCNDRFVAVGSASGEWSEKDIRAVAGRGEVLATDPAKGNKITSGGVEEAAVALTAERQRVFGHATREATGSAEFIDEKGVAWDVKSPLSPPSNGNSGGWVYSPEHQLEKVRHDFNQGDKVLLNLSRVNDKDRDDTLKLFAQNLSCQERDNILILTDREVLYA